MPDFHDFLQTVYRNDPKYTPLERYQQDSTFSCRTLSLIVYGLGAGLQLSKCRHSVFRDSQIDV